MSSILPLRPYQQECVESVEQYFADGGKRGAVVLPTASGKTIMFSHLGKRFVEQHPNKKVLILSHTDELVNQAKNKFSQQAPGLHVGIVKANVREVAAPVISASVQSLRNPKSRSDIRDVGLIIADECHHFVAKTFLEVLEHYGAFDDSSPVKIAGFTATLSRGDEKKLADVWEKVVYTKDILWMIRNGYLLDVIGKRVEVPDLDFSKIKKRAGDYAEGELGQALTDSLAPELTAKSYVEHASDRSGLLFAPTVSSAYVMSQALREQGINCEVVHGALPMHERRDIIRRFDKGEIQVISNCMALSEGFDSPRASCVVIARQTKSAILYAQMIGRGLRLYPGQKDALILDVVGASRMHDLRSLIDLTDENISLDENLSLAQRAEQAEQENEDSGTDDANHYYGPVEVKDFDPLVRDSQRVWLQTRGGTYFLSAGEVYVFLVPCVGDCGADQWDVAWCSKPNSIKYPVKTGGFTDHRGVDLSYAFAWGEDTAEEMGGASTDWLCTKGKSWRKSKASPKSLKLARGRGLDVDYRMSGDEVSNLIDADIASGRIDAVVSRITR